MKTYRLNQPLERISQESTIQFEKAMLQDKWYIYDSDQITDTIIFHADNTLELLKVFKNKKGEWNYMGGDLFSLHIDEKLDELHLVHLDNNLMIFEQGDTKKYLILISYHAMKSLSLNSLFNIEYYLKKVREQMREYTKNPSMFRQTVPYFMPIVVMGGLHHADFWSNHDDKEVEHKKERSEAESEMLDEGLVEGDMIDEDLIDRYYSDEEIDADLLDEEPEFATSDNNVYVNDDEYDNQYEDDNENDEEYYDTDDDKSNEYGGFTEEEIIYDYLESQEEDDFLS